MLDLWEAFNDVAEGFGLTILELREMLQCSVKEYLGFSEKRLIEVADAVFRILDDDKVRFAWTCFTHAKLSLAFELTQHY